LRPFASADVTGDANVDVRDLQAVASALVGRRDLSAEEQRSADTNGNGRLDEGDLTGLLDRVLRRNGLVPGATGSGALAKQVYDPEYRYEEPEGGEGYGGYSRGYSAVMSLAASRGGTRELGAILATFALPRSGALPRVMPATGVRVVWAASAGRLRVLAYSEDGLRAGASLFYVRGVAARLEAVTGSTRGGTPRILLAAGTGPGATPSPDDARRSSSRPLRKKHPGAHDR
ncbi:MAG: hypothetical protein H0V09_09665, partial [Gemmatimonadetes bacterium]|nr:hypothetical protein [Gemmatimonadota bacterium]